MCFLWEEMEFCVSLPALHTDCDFHASEKSCSTSLVGSAFKLLQSQLQRCCWSWVQDTPQQGRKGWGSSCRTDRVNTWVPQGISDGQSRILCSPEGLGWVQLPGARRKWKFFTFWTRFQLQGRTEGGTHSKEAFVGLGFHLQLLPKPSHLSQLQSSYDRVIILIGRQNKKALRQTNEVNCAAAGASWTHFVGNGFTQLQIQQNLWKKSRFSWIPTPQIISGF